jgi:NTE family protein
LLEDERLDIEGISGASAGAVNAVALAQGHLGHPPGPDQRAATRASARQCLRRVWEGVVSLGSVGALTQNVMHLMLNTSVGGQMLQSMAPWMSPYQVNPLDLNPLRKLLATHIDFEGLARLHAPRVFISATHVRTGLARVFSGQHLDLQAVMASTCLPMLFRTVEIDGEPYWDGGYSSNPPMAPLIKQCEAQDILVVQINPLQRQQTPHAQAEILTGSTN